MNLLISTLIITVVHNIVKLIGLDLITELLWNVVVKFSSNPTYQKLNHLKTDQLQTYKEQQRISAQDEYAKWTKLNRRLDKLKKDIEQVSLEISSQRTSFNGVIKMILSLTLKYSIIFIQFWYRSTPVYYLPLNIFPSWLVWFLRFPSAPPNSISVSVWCFSIDTVMGTMFHLIKNFFKTEDTKSE